MGTVMLFLINIAFSLYIFVLMLRIMTEWTASEYYHPVSQLLFRLTDPLVKPLQKILPNFRRLDCAAVLCLLIVELIKLTLFGVLSASFPNIPGLFVWALGDLLKELINLYFYMIILFVLFSWLGAGNARTAELAMVLFRLVDPLLRQARRLIPTLGGIDFSPLVVVLVLQLFNLLAVMPFITFGMVLAFGV